MILRRLCVWSSPNYWCSRALLRTSSRHQADSVLSRLKDFVFATEKENFHSDFVSRAHRWDRVSADEWTLVYRDLGSSRTFFLMSICFPASAIGALVIAWDITQNRKEDRFEIVNKFTKDAKQLGSFIAVPAIALVVITVLLVRAHSIRLLRIYQRKRNPEEFMAIVPQAIVRQTKLKFPRDCAVATYIDDEGMTFRSLFLLLTVGNVQFGDRHFIVDHDCFRGNNYRSYMLNETTVPPRL